MSAMKLRIAAMLLLPLVSSCKPEESLRTDLFSDGCAQLFSCGCIGTRFDDAKQCEEVQAGQFAGTVERAEAAGLMIDEACVQANDIYLRLACATDEDEAPEECSYCAVAHGTVALGQPCIDGDNSSDCAQGLRCDAEVCVDPCAKPKPGEVCRDPITLDIADCEEGLYCASSGMCAPVAGINEPCEEAPCAEGFLCIALVGMPLLCEPLEEEGQECISPFSCVEGLLCDSESGTCTPRPGAGESCYSGDCTDGLSCNSDDGTGTGTCGPPPSVGESCSEKCEGEAVCSFGTCTALPGEGEACFNGWCAAGFKCGEDEIFCVTAQVLICEY